MTVNNNVSLRTHSVLVASTTTQEPERCDVLVGVFVFPPLTGAGVLRRVRDGRGQPGSGAASPGDHPVALLQHVPALGRPPAAAALRPVAARQAHAHGGHRLLAGPLDVQLHCGQAQHRRGQLHVRAGARLAGDSRVKPGSDTLDI